MPIISNSVQIKWTLENRAWYEYKKYEFTQYNQYFKVLVKDLLPHSSIKVTIQCDFCGKITKKQFYRCQYICNCNDKACIQKRIQLTNLRKYGVKHAWQAIPTKRKIIETLKNKYGVTKVSDIPFIREKIFLTRKNKDSIPYSVQQKHLRHLFNGKLNYPLHNYAIDIALPDEKIAIEYNGSGHDLTVQHGLESAECFSNKEEKRKTDIISLGWKLIIINSSNDILVDDSKLRKLFKFSKEQFKFNWKQIIIWDFDKNQIILDDYIITFNNFFSTYL